MAKRYLAALLVLAFRHFVKRAKEEDAKRHVRGGTADDELADCYGHTDLSTALGSGSEGFIFTALSRRLCLCLQSSSPCQASASLSSHGSRSAHM